MVIHEGQLELARLRRCHHWIDRVGRWREGCVECSIAAYSARTTAPKKHQSFPVNEEADQCPAQLTAKPR